MISSIIIIGINESIKTFYVLSQKEKAEIYILFTPINQFINTHFLLPYKKFNFELVYNKLFVYQIYL